MLDTHIAALEQILAGVRLVGEASPRVRARVMATGELLATSLGAAFLRAQSLPCAWVDARTMLESAPGRDRSARARYLSARCHYDPDPELQRRLAALQPIILTQGFIARDAKGETVLLAGSSSRHQA